MPNDLLPPAQRPGPLSPPVQVPPPLSLDAPAVSGSLPIFRTHGSSNQSQSPLVVSANVREISIAELASRFGCFAEAAVSTPAPIVDNQAFGPER